MAALRVQAAYRVEFQQGGFAGAGVADNQQQALFANSALQDRFRGQVAAVFRGSGGFRHFQQFGIHFPPLLFAQPQGNEYLQGAHFQVGGGLETVKIDSAVLLFHPAQVAALGFIGDLELDSVFGFTFGFFFPVFGGFCAFFRLLMKDWPLFAFGNYFPFFGRLRHFFSLRAERFPAFALGFYFSLSRCPGKLAGLLSGLKRQKYPDQRCDCPDDRSEQTDQRGVLLDPVKQGAIIPGCGFFSLGSFVGGICRNSLGTGGPKTIRPLRRRSQRRRRISGG